MANITPEQQAQIDMNVLIGATDFGNRFEEDEKRGKRDTQSGRFAAHADYGSDSELVVSFSTIPVLNKMESIKANAPKYIDQNYITIIVPGNRLLTYHGPVTDFYEWRFPKEYEAFKSGKDAIQTGTPLAHWLEMTPSMIKELDFYGIRTVEQVANLSDSNSGVLRSFYAMKEKAKVFLAEANDKSTSTILHMQIEKQDAEMAELKSQMAALMEAMKAKEEPKQTKVAKTDK